MVLIQTPDEYISWIDHGGISIVSESEYNNYYKNLTYLVLFKVLLILLLREKPLFLTWLLVQF
ncbi:MAG: hypothetical protein Ct9H90mP3_5630 [Flammeovirgaceae bacterium]|nr:MAG: hypothetical protein Ct9H90mP3_5630 [Flammeovirgaceae bacterium]